MKLNVLFLAMKLNVLFLAMKLNVLFLAMKLYNAAIIPSTAESSESDRVILSLSDNSNALIASSVMATVSALLNPNSFAILSEREMISALFKPKVFDDISSDIVIVSAKFFMIAIRVDISSAILIVSALLKLKLLAMLSDNVILSALFRPKPFEDILSESETVSALLSPKVFDDMASDKLIVSPY